jgi:CBS domain-containing protein
MRCDEVMKGEAERVRPEDTLHHAAQLMRDRNIGFLPVCDAEERALGTITDRDIVIRACADDRAMGSTRVEEVMSREVVACGPGDDIEECEALMAKRRKSRVMICDEGGRLVGVISLSDIARRERARVAGKTLRRIAKREVGAS